MKKSLAGLVFCVILLGLSGEIEPASQGLQKVEYLVDSVLKKEGEYVRLLGGSSWIFALPSRALFAEEIIIIFQEIELQNKNLVKVAVAYIDGEEIQVKHAAGTYITETGYLTRVIEALNKGALLRLANGLLLSVPKYDQFYTGWWLPPYEALITGNMLYLYNLKKGKRVWVSPIK